MVQALSTRQVAGKALVARPVGSRLTARRAPMAPVRALSDLNVVVSTCTFGALALGRFVFLPFQRKTNSAAGLPVQNGVTHFEAGDQNAKEASFVLKSNDPSGFNLIDVFAWGSLGHAFAYSVLASQSILNTL